MLRVSDFKVPYIEIFAKKKQILTKVFQVFATTVSLVCSWKCGSGVLVKTNITCLTEDNVGGRVKQFMTPLANGKRIHTTTTSSIKLASISKVFNFARESVSAVSERQSHVQKGHQDFSTFIC